MVLSRRGWSPWTEYCSHTWSLPATDGPTLGMVSVEAEKWARKDEVFMQSALGWVFKGS